jgi:hypothetical protein
MRDVLDLTDPVDSEVVSQVLKAAEMLRLKRQEKFFENLTTVIANAIGKAFK